MNAKLEAVALKTADGINEMGILAEVHLEAIERLLQQELSTLDSDLAIAQAAREWLKWHNNADECNKAEHKLRAAVEKANTLTPRSADAPTTPAVQ